MDDLIEDEDLDGDDWADMEEVLDDDSTLDLELDLEEDADLDASLEWAEDEDEEIDDDSADTARITVGRRSRRLVEKAT